MFLLILKYGKFDSEVMEKIIWFFGFWLLLLLVVLIGLLIFVLVGLFFLIEVVSCCLFVDVDWNMGVWWFLFIFCIKMVKVVVVFCGFDFLLVVMILRLYLFLVVKFNWFFRVIILLVVLIVKVLFLFKLYCKCWLCLGGLWLIVWMIRRVVLMGKFLCIFVEYFFFGKIGGVLIFGLGELGSG